MSSRSVCADVILQLEHSSPLVMLLLSVVVGRGMCKYFVVVDLCNVGFFSHLFRCVSLIFSFIVPT